MPLALRLNEGLGFPALLEEGIFKECRALDGEILGVLRTYILDQSDKPSRSLRRQHDALNQDFNVACH